MTGEEGTGMSGGVANERSQKLPKTKRGVRTREAILAAAESTFARDGYIGARIVDIAAVAGVALGTFYTYFENKDEVLWAVLRPVFDEMYESSRAPWLDEQPYGAVRRGLAGYITAYHKHADMMRVVREAVTVRVNFAEMWFNERSRFLARIVRNIERSHDLGSPRLDPVLEASALGGMLDDFCWVWLSMGGDTVPGFERQDQVTMGEAVDVLATLWHGALFPGSALPNERPPAEPWALETTPLRTQRDWRDGMATEAGDVHAEGSVARSRSARVRR